MQQLAESIRRAVMFMFILALPATGFSQIDLSEAWELGVTVRQYPGKVMDAIGVKPGMVIGEIGAGRGRFTVYLAQRVGAKGKILANDIDEDAIVYLEERCKNLGFTNVQSILGRVDDPMFPKKSIDMAIMVWVYHILTKPDDLLRNLKKSLKKGACLVIIDPIDEEIDETFKIDRRRADVSVPRIKERIQRSAQNAGYDIIRVEKFLPRDYIFILKPKD